MPQRNVASNFTFEQQRVEINNLAQDFWSQKGTVDTALPTFLKHDGSNNFTGQTLAVPNAFTINSNSGNGTVTIAGNLQVDGTTTTVNTATMDVVDKNITIAKGSANDAAADGAGITIDSATDITFNFVDAKDALVSSIGLEGTTFLKAPYGQFIGSGTPTGGQGVEINAPDTNTGQISSYDRANTAYKELRLKGSSIGIYGGTSNALVGTFNSTGLTLESGDLTIPNDIIHSGDTDTKIAFTDNQIGITTGAAERLQISNFGLFVQAGLQLGFLATSGPSPSIKSGGTDNQDLLFTSGTGNPARVIVDSSGNVNFGAEKAVAFPSGTGIQVYHSANPRIKLTNDATGNTSTDGTQIYLSNDGETIIDNKDGKDIRFDTGGSEKFRIKSTATGSFLGIGNSTTNSSIAATLQVIAADGEADELYVAKFQNLEETAGRSYGVDIRAGSNSTDHSFRVKNRANDTTQFLIRGDGHIESVVNTTSSGAYFKNENTTDGFGLRIDGGGTTADRYSLAVFNAAGEESFRVNANKNVGIGTYNPSQPLTIKRSSANQGAFGLRFEYENTVGPTSTSSAILVGSTGLNFKNYNSSRNFIFETGDVYPSSNGGQNLGTGSNRWLDVYTENLNVTKASGNLSTYITATNGLGTIEIAGSTGAFIDLKTPTSDDFDMRVGTSGTGGYINTDSNSTLSVNCPIVPDANGSYDLGGSGNRWANVYSADLQLSNKGSTNEVDGTWGDFTIQEGESDLFLINRRNGKKYKFNITEVS